MISLNKIKIRKIWVLCNIHNLYMVENLKIFETSKSSISLKILNIFELLKLYFEKRADNKCFNLSNHV